MYNRLFENLVNWWSSKDIRIKTLEERNTTLAGKNILLLNENSALSNELAVAKGDILIYKEIISEQQKYKPKTIAEYKEWMKSNIPKKVKTYPFRGVRKATHLHFEQFSKNDALIEKFEVFLRNQSLLRDYKTPEDLVYVINLGIDKYIKTFGRDQYRTDYDVFKKEDYWMSPEETFDFYVNQKKAGDCDDTGTFKYCAIITALKYMGWHDEHAWRLKVFLVTTITGVGHYLLGWLKEASGYSVGWIIVESTYYQDKFKEIWTNNLNFRDNILYRIWYSFDEKAEYEKIGMR